MAAVSFSVAASDACSRATARCSVSLNTVVNCEITLVMSWVVESGREGAAGLARVDAFDLVVVVSVVVVVVLAVALVVGRVREHRTFFWVQVSQAAPRPVFRG
jgi:hypothetical protein